MQLLKNFMAKVNKTTRYLILAAIAAALATGAYASGMFDAGVTKAKAAIESVKADKDDNDNDSPPPTAPATVEPEVTASPPKAAEAPDEGAEAVTEAPTVAESPPEEPVPEAPDNGCADDQYAIVPPGKMEAVACIPSGGG